MTLHTTITGPLDAPAVLFLHGFMGAADDWGEVTSALSEDFRCITVDLPGHGASVGLPEERYAFDGTIAALAEALGDLDVERCRVVGYSLGARLALALALREPRRIARLVLESGSPGLRTDAERAARRALDAERAEQIESDFEAFLGAWSRMPLFGLADRSDRRDEFVERRRRNIPAELARSLRGSGTGQQPSLWTALATLAIPTLAVAGGRDERYVDLAFEMAAAGPTVMPLVVPAGHAVHAEQPDVFAALARSFLYDPIPDAHLVS